MKVKTFAAVLAFSLAIGVHVNNVSAFPVTWEFEGVVDTTATDINNLFGGAVTFGMPISGQFTFESTTPDVFPEDEVTGNYRNAIVSITGFLGDIPFAREFGTSTSIGIDNDFINAPNSIKDAFRGGGDINIVGQILGFGIFLTDADATMFSNDSLPLYPPDLAIIEFATFSITSQPLGVNFSGHLTSLVPEPATLTLLAVGAFACLKRRCRTMALFNGEQS